MLFWKGCGQNVGAEASLARSAENTPLEYFGTYCFDCHDEETSKGDLNIESLLANQKSDLNIVFEHLISSRMPPANKDQPSAVERNRMLRWLAEREAERLPNEYRRLNRHEFVQSANDLLGVKLDLTSMIPEDRGTYNFDTDRRIQLTREMLGAYFHALDDMLEFALPSKGFLPERVWITNRIKDSHRTYNIYTRPFREGILFSWTRANNGNNYSFFYDDFVTPEKGWYELTFEAMKVGEFVGDASLMVYAGKYYYADDRPQPQRLLDVISLGEGELAPHSIRVFLNPGEIVSVHCYSRHNFRQQNGEEGIYIKQLKVQGPVFDQWPPKSYRQVFSGLPLKRPAREPEDALIPRSQLEAIGGRLVVSSFQEGMGKEKMLDGSNRSFWHTRFSPTLAEPPHYVILENPERRQIDGLSYSTWSGGNGNGQVKSYAIYVSEDGEEWGEPILAGDLEIRLANQQLIHFAESTSKPFIKFLVTDAFSLDGRSLASIGKLDVLTALSAQNVLLPVTVSSRSVSDLRLVIRRFAERAFSSQLSDEDLEPYFQVAMAVLEGGGDFVEATRLGLKAVLGSHRFLMVPGNHVNPSYETAAVLARVLWLSVPDQGLMKIAKTDQLVGSALDSEIERMLLDPRSDRMVRSLCRQWLDLRKFKEVTPSLKLYPLYDDLLNRYLPLETEAYLAALIRENRSVGHLIDSNFSFLNQRLAQHYGIEGVVGQRMRKVHFGPEVPRGGLLTMGSVLKVTADGFDTSPILRGAWISKRVAGNTLSPPPENVGEIESMPGEESLNLRGQIEQHKRSPSCYACHKSIDPYGFALESFDATGQWREHYRVKRPHKGTFQYRPSGYYRAGDPVDPSGDIFGTAFSDIFGLKKVLLADHKKVAYHFVKTFFEYANGYQPSLRQRLDLYAMIPNVAEQCRMKDLLAQTLIYSLGELQ